MFIGLTHYLVLSALLFSLGTIGIFLNRRHVISILMSIELILLAANLNFVAFSADCADLVGQIFSLIILTIAAAEISIGLAIVIVYFRNHSTIAIDDASRMKG